jgi:hypothetical protein
MGRFRFIGSKAQGAMTVGGAPIADDSITVGDKVYVFQVAAANNLEITIGGSDAATATNIVNAINANPPSASVDARVDSVDDTTVRLVADDVGSQGNITLAEAVTDAGFTVSGAALTGGENANFQTLDAGTYTVTTLDVTAESVEIDTAVSSPIILSYSVFSATGLFKGTLSNLITVSGSRILHDFTGATDVVAGDVIHWMVRD